MVSLTGGARVAQLVMGLVLVVSGLAKVWEPVLFYWEAIPYAELLGMGREAQPMAARFALVLGPLETGLGLALLLDWRRWWTLPAAAALMAFFLALTGWAWYADSAADCGCFGALMERTPGEATVEDAVFLALLVFAWWGRRSMPRADTPRSKRLVVAGTVAAVAVGGIRFVPEMSRLDGSDLQVGVRLTSVGLKGVDLDLMSGEYLVELFSPTCGRCKEEVPKLNKWSADPELPAIVALHKYGEESSQATEFKKRLQPEYDIAAISTTDFSRLVWKHGYPRLAYVRDGVVQAVWEYYEMPSGKQIKNLLGWKKTGAAGTTGAGK